MGEGFGWYLFAGASGRAVGRDIFLDGNSWRHSASVRKRPAVADLEAGAALFWRDMRLSFTQDIRSQEFVGQRKAFTYGIVTLAVAF